MSGRIDDPYARGPDVSEDEPPADQEAPAGHDPASSSEPSPSKPTGWGLRSMSTTLLGLIGVNAALFAVLAWRVYREQRIDEAAAESLPHFEVIIPAPAVSPPPTGVTSEEQRTIQVFQSAAPSVVFITTLTFHRDVFRRDVLTIPAGTGSGFMWDDKGHVVTNFHVIKDGQAARVTLSDQTSFGARLVGTAADKDIAVLKIDAPAAKLKALPRGSSKGLGVGQQALAIGNPFGLDHTLSVGVVSGLNREIQSLAGRPILGVIQTDAAINPGNSGGPLLDSSGRLIGINTAIFSPSGTSAGIGFAVPVDTVERIVPQLIEHGRVIRPGLGIQFDPDIQRRAGIKGVLVIAVVDGSPAAQAGIVATTRDPRTGDLLLGDVIVQIENTVVEDQDDLFKALDSKQVGDTLRVKLRRGAATRDVDVKLAPLDE